MEVLRLVAQAQSTREIADGLFLSVNTVRNYVSRILTKLDAHSKLEAVALAVRNGILPSSAIG
jgi:DNA-binding CsgD family transcriptional regulator